ncbi:MAG: sensor signal transduction histidine kinase, partial [Marmoricola sp.]|nr:sensor signal transduction histidine kinase [Marmoricola sp.]
MQLVPARTVGAVPPLPRRARGLLLLGTVVFVLAGLLGRATAVDGHTLSLVWPAAGVAMLMTGACARRDRPLALLLVAAAAYVLNVLTGVDAALSSVLVVSNLGQALVGGLLLRRTATGLLGGPDGVPAQARVRDVSGVLVSSVVGSFVGAGLGALGARAVAGTWSWADAAVWWGRDGAGAVVVLLTVLLLAAGPHPGDAPPAAVDARSGLVRVAEPVALVVATALLYLTVFVALPTAPLAFPLLLPTVWVGRRFSPAVVALHGAAVSLFVIALTVTGRGPFVDGRSWHQEALVAQGFLVLVVGLGLVLALGRA